MNKENLIPISRFCEQHQIEISFVSSLCVLGIFEVVTINRGQFITTEQVADLEKLVRFHYDMEINLEGIDVINNLLGKVVNLQEEVFKLRRRLGLYE